MDSHSSFLRTAGEIFSHGVWISALLKLLPPLAALFSLAWSGVQLYDRFFKKKKSTSTSSTPSP